MGTYADYYNEQRAKLAPGHAHRSDDGPVRLTISRGDYVFDSATGELQYEEVWEKEELMDHEELVDAAEEDANRFDGPRFGSPNLHSPKPGSKGLPAVCDSLARLARGRRLSLMVLDT